MGPTLKLKYEITVFCIRHCNIEDFNFIGAMLSTILSGNNLSLRYTRTVSCVRIDDFCLLLP